MKTLPPDTFLRPPEEGARLLALRLMNDARAALARLDDPDDAGALHAFRVSLRRFRSVLRAWLPWLRRSRTRRGIEIARTLAAGTSRARDLEVQIAWLETLRAELTPTQRRALDHLLAELRERAAHVRGGSLDDAPAAFAKLEKAMAGWVEQYATVVRVDGKIEGPTFGEVAARLLREQAARLARELDAVNGPWDEQRAHRARIQAKRLRYLMEPVAKSAPGGKPLLRCLKSLQDVLGEFNDMRMLIRSVTSSLERAAGLRIRTRLDAVLAEDAESARALARRTLEDGLLEIAARANRHRLALYDTFAEAWKGEPGTPFFRDLDTFAQALADLGRPAAQPPTHLKLVR